MKEEELEAHRIASIIAQRWTRGVSLGRPSLYNIAREVLAEELEQMFETKASSDRKI